MAVRSWATPADDLNRIWKAQVEMPDPDSAAESRGPHGLDMPALRAWLTGKALQPSGRLSVQRVGLGQSNLTFRVRDETDASWILRRPPLGAHSESAHDVTREARIMVALGASDVPVPAVVGVAEAGTIGWDVPASVIGFVEGRVVDGPDLVAGLDHIERAAIGAALSRALASVHAVDLDQVGLDDLASHQPYAERQLRRWTRQWKGSGARELPALDALTARLSSPRFIQGSTVLVHGDFHLRNVLLSPAAIRVAAVLDWELSTLGDPIADLGTLLAYWPAPGEAGTDLFKPSTLPGFISQDAIVETYASASSRDVSTAGYWHALALWKLAIIAEGVLQRTTAEPLNRAQAGVPTTDLIDGLIDRGHRVAEAAGY
jgi:aminoglycoside phosphotransferase (APT) family kinase protein